jgi:hypothetical protein
LEKALLIKREEFIVYKIIAIMGEAGTGKDSLM